jgi:ribosomal-protein-alanine acetyltransferase
MQIRKGTPADYVALRPILEQSREAAQWIPDGYDFFVAETGDQVSGFLVWRQTAPDEIEILNLAVAAEFRRKGIATSLLEAVSAADIFLEVRESNLAARQLYAAAGFVESGLRPRYYQHPVEGAIVMRLQS